MKPHSTVSLLKRSVVLGSTLLSLSATGLHAADAKTSVTIYSKSGTGGIQPHLYRPVVGQHHYIHYNQIPGYAMVRTEHDITLSKNRSTFNLTDVAAYIDPTTVSFKSLTDPKGTSVLEQNFMFDLVSLNKLAERYIDQDISFEKIMGGDKPNQIISGTLLSAYNNQLVIKTDEGNIVSSYANNAIFPKLPDGFYTKPTLVWDIYTKKPGKHRIETSYQTDGITWWADYNATFKEGKDANSGFLDLGAWVSILNKSGGSYEDAKLKLIAGDVNRAPVAGTAGFAQGFMAADAVMELEEAAPAGFSEKSFFEFHLYTLGRDTTIPNNSTKQVELFPKANNIPIDKKFVYYGADPNMRYYGGTNYNRDYGTTGNKKIDVYIEFKNEKEKGLGIPLPAGKIRVNKLDEADGSLEFIGEDTIDHTPKNEKVLLKLGSAFDIVGERKQTDFKVDHRRKYMDETYEITLRNHKDEAVDIIIKEPLYRSANWKLYNQTHDYEKIDAQNIKFTVTVPKDGTKTLSYLVRYTWK